MFTSLPAANDQSLCLSGIGQETERMREKEKERKESEKNKMKKRERTQRVESRKQSAVTRRTFRE